MTISALISVTVPICIYFLTHESPRFLISKYRYQEAFDVIEKMERTNKGFSMPLTDTEKEIIIL